MLLHITTPDLWEAARSCGRYEAPSLIDEGFIHCSTPRQITATANRFYAGREDLIVLCIDPDVLTAEVVFENTLGGEELFPHVYGAIDLAAVTEARAWPPLGGRFTDPDWLERAGDEK